MDAIVWKQIKAETPEELLKKLPKGLADRVEVDAYESGSYKSCSVGTIEFNLPDIGRVRVKPASADSLSIEIEVK